MRSARGVQIQYRQPTTDRVVKVFKRIYQAKIATRKQFAISVLFPRTTKKRGKNGVSIKGVARGKITALEAVYEGCRIEEGNRRPKGSA